MSRLALVFAAGMLFVGVSFARDADAATTRPAPPVLAAAFAATSYAPGQLAKLRVLGRIRRLEVQVLRGGAERAWSSIGRPWGPPVQVRVRGGAGNTPRGRAGGVAGGGPLLPVFAP